MTRVGGPRVPVITPAGVQGPRDQALPRSSKQAPLASGYAKTEPKSGAGRMASVVGFSSPAVAAVALGMIALASPAEAQAANYDATPEVDLASAQTVEAKDSKEKELFSKVGKLIDKKFGGDYRAAFDHYDKGGDGALSKSEIKEVLEDAGVGNGFTRGFWVDGILERFDEKNGGNSNGKLDWKEFAAVIPTGNA